MHPSTNSAAAVRESGSKERFLILARALGTLTKSLTQVLAPLGRVEVIVDQPAGGEHAPKEESSTVISIADDEAEGYGGLMSHWFPAITAWSRAFVHLDRTLKSDEAVWFVEDDVAADARSIAELVRKTAARGADLSAIDLRSRAEDEHWPWWGYAENYFPEPRRAFQPLCRLSGKLVRRILDFRAHFGRFTFHEVLFASLAHESRMIGLDWKSSPEFRDLVASFRHYPVVSHPVIGVCHPVKDPRLHAEICNLSIPRKVFWSVDD